MQELSQDEIERIADWLAGVLPSSEAREAEQWMAARPERAGLIQRLRSVQEVVRRMPSLERHSRVVDEINRVTNPETRRFLTARASTRESVSGYGLSGMRKLGSQTLRRWTWMAGAASLPALIAAFFTVHSLRLPGATHTYTTTVGQRATVSLDDGTHVMMAPQTTLRLVEFSQHSRTMVLDGDAYFEVARSTTTPFIVKSGTTTTRVLGTAFEVRHYPGDAEVRVAVASGKVLVSSGVLYPEVPVMAGYVASVTDSIPVVTTVDDINTEIGWLGDQLVFQNAPMSKVLATLTRWYGYQFRCADSTVVLSHITIGLSMRSSTEALASLERLLNVSLTFVGDTVTLTPARTRGATPQRTKHYDMWIPTREVGR